MLSEKFIQLPSADAGTSCIRRFTKQFLPGRQLDVVTAALCRELGNQSRAPFVQNPALDW